ncbi:ecdysone-inducible gene E1 isoform X2 [Calliopsis andreniformis]|uniref:ecdysone-inducible gene E1 isoform X2 n=1 Tax=Calliopsis andreniformis TaxID=337506 RepID=UPI003FCE191F
MRGHYGTIFLLSVLIHCSGPVLSSPTTRSLKLGDGCTRDEDCERSIVSSQCRRGSCRCLPYFASYNETHCLEATLLGQECLVEEQCSLKVANSGCYDGFCGCKDGFLQFRRHTCLGPAKLGEVCYEHAHCRLWQENSHCDFLIPDLFGRCQCTAPMRRENDICRLDDLVKPLPLDQTSTSVLTEAPGEDLDSEQISKPEETGVQMSWLKNDSTSSSTTGVLIPVNLVTKPNTEDSDNQLLPTEVTTNSYNSNHDGNNNEDDSIVVDAITETTTVFNSSWTSGPGKADRHEASAATPVSLGHDCFTDFECRLADPYSRCIDGVCDCGFAGNGTCSAKNRGCAPGTFQCRSSGQCISWFFVCDGRPDCADGSDERCSARDLECPGQAFRCEKSGICLSKAVLCDGRRDCPQGEDETGCNNRRKCPDGAFRCNNGQCLPAYEFCNAVVSCRDGSDEPRGACRTRYRGRISSRHCPFRCDNGRCRSDAITCSGRDGCGDGSDEKQCSVCRCSAFV